MFLSDYLQYLTLGFFLLCSLFRINDMLTMKQIEWGAILGIYLFYKRRVLWKRLVRLLWPGSTSRFNDFRWPTEMFKQCSYHNVTVRVDHSSAPPTQAHTVWCVMSLEGSPHLIFTVYLHYYYYFILEHAMEYGLSALQLQISYYSK